MLLLGAVSGLLVLVALMLFGGESFGGLADIAWSAAAGVSGALGIASLYAGLSIGSAAVVASTAAVVGVVLPVVVGIFTLGFPRVTQVVGFVAAIAGIWLVSGSVSGDRSSFKRVFGYATTAGLGFGGFFILIAQVESEAVFTPLVISKLIALVTALLVLLVRRMPVPALTSNPLALLAGVFDAAGNIFYLLASQYTRLDIAVILTSMAPAVTVLLSNRVLHERVSPGQWLGVGLCVVAVFLILI